MLQVYRGTGKNKEQVAIKVIENAPSKHEEIQTEMGVFQKFGKHPNLVDYYGTYLFHNANNIPNQIWIAMEVGLMTIC